jgi:hypothetical protein
LEERKQMKKWMCGAKYREKKKGGRDINQVIFMLEGTVILFQLKVYATFPSEITEVPKKLLRIL